MNVIRQDTRQIHILSNQEHLFQSDRQENVLENVSITFIDKVDRFHPIQRENLKHMYPKASIFTLVQCDNIWDQEHFSTVSWRL